MITTNISNIPDAWVGYFEQQVNKYTPSVEVSKPWRPPVCPEPIMRPCGPHKTQFIIKHKNPSMYTCPADGCNICDPCHPNRYSHMNMPCFNQHKPYGIATTRLMPPFEDDDRPDWHKFHSKNRKPMIFEEVIDENGCSHGPHGTINVRPVEPADDSKDEIEDEVTL